ncbi:MAG: helix-turn-helix domain-containing protein [Chitinophagales bacterium]|nr:helix-turn-helix domain-containing protein [Chitinophagales bacterium]
MVNDVSNIFLATTVVLSILFGVVLIVKSNSKTPTLLLGLFLIFYSSEGIIPLLEIFISRPLASHMLFFPFSMGKFIFVPLLYLYAKNLVSPISYIKEWKHLLPGTIEFLFFTVLFLFPAATKRSIWESETTDLYFLLYLIVSFFYAVYYVFKTIRFINTYKLEIENFYSTLEGKLLSWIKKIALFLLTVGVVWFVLNFFIPFLFSEEKLDLLETYVGLIIDTINLFFIGYVAIMGLKQSALLDFVHMKFEDAQKTTLTPAASQNELEEASNNRLYNCIIDYMKNKEPFTNPNLTLVAFASDLNVPARKLSEVIKLKTSYNFNQFINSYRVEKAKKLLTAPNYTHYTILGIAGEAGFNSKATFNTSFKQFAKMTPSQFKRQFHNI